MKHFTVNSGDFVTTTSIYRMLDHPGREVTLVHGDAVPTFHNKKVKFRLIQAVKHPERQAGSRAQHDLAAAGPRPGTSAPSVPFNERWMPTTPSVRSEWRIPPGSVIFSVVAAGDV
jgi:hypothetical protein